MSNKNAAENKTGLHTSLSKFCLANACCWAGFWLLFLVASLPNILFAESKVWSPDEITQTQSQIVQAGAFVVKAVRWLLPISLPVVWLIFNKTCKITGTAERAVINRGGLVSVLTAAAMLAINGLCAILAGIHTDGAVAYSLLTRLYALLTALPIGGMLLAYAAYVRYSGVILKSEKLRSFGTGFMIAAGVIAFINVLASCVTVIIRDFSATWVNIDWLISLPMGTAVMFDAVRSAAALKKQEK